MKSKDVIKIWNETGDALWALEKPCTATNIVDWLIWTDGVCYPGCLAPLNVIMNMIAIDMIMRGEY